MRAAILLSLLLCLSIVLLGCGETMSGMGKDTKRMGQGISTFFFRQ